MRNGTKHAFPSFQTFVAMKFELKDVRMVPNGVLDGIKMGDMVPATR